MMGLAKNSDVWFWLFIASLIILAGLIYTYPETPSQRADSMAESAPSKNVSTASLNQTAAEMTEKAGEPGKEQAAEVEEVKPGARPGEGWTLHIDAKKHFPYNSSFMAHHYCKPVSGGLTECQLYDSDAPDARLVGVEVIVGPETYNNFSALEKRLWHYHKTEIAKVEATLPDIKDPAEAERIVKGIEETYGKVYIIWDPSRGDLPVGVPKVTILD